MGRSKARMNASVNCVESLNYVLDGYN